VTHKPLHWSEKAKMNPPSPESTVGGSPRPEHPGRAPLATRKPPTRGRPGRTLWISLAIVICVGAGAAALWFWHPSGEGTLTKAGAQSSNTYESPSLGCTFEYPDSWVEYTPAVALGSGFNEPTAFIVGDPNTANAQGSPTEYVLFWGLRSHEKISPKAMGIMEGAVADVMDNNPSTVTLYEPVTEIKVNGMAARSFATRDPGPLGPTITRSVTIISGDGAYLFDFCSPESSLDLNRPIFNAILDSFRPQQ
jgi:predicted Zn-dependent protease